jgi:uncharacterized protein (DUF1015 family)
VSTAEALALAEGNPSSFLHVIRPEIGLPDGTDPYSDAVYGAARAGLDRLLSEGMLRREQTPGIHLYRQVWNGRSQTGLVCCCHVDDYRTDIIRKHEKTRQDKEDDRTRHLLSLDAHTGPVFLAYRNDAELEALIANDQARRPWCHFVTPDGVTHTVWDVADPEPYIALMANVPHAYVADGHHRSASAERAATHLAGQNPSHTGSEEYNWFLSVLFPAESLSVLPYNRVVRDLNGMSTEAFLEALGRCGELVTTDTPEPDRPCTFGVHVDGTWWMLAIDEGSVDWSDSIGSLDVSILQDRVLTPILGIGDPRTDERISFVGGIRGTDELEARVAAGGAAFALHATSMDQLLAVSDDGKCMPPKSTWFEPKLRSGLFVHAMDSASCEHPQPEHVQETTS